LNDKRKYNPQIHHRKSIRLKGFDYSQHGLYFITICCQNKECRFGQIENNKMILNKYGIIAYNEWVKLPIRFRNCELDVFQIMPNHMHGIIVLNDVKNLETLQINDVVGAGFTLALTNDGHPENGQPPPGQPQGIAPTQTLQTNDVVGAGFTIALTNDGHPENGQPPPGQPQGIAPTQTLQTNDVVGAGFTPAPTNDGHPENGQPPPGLPQGIAPTQTLQINDVVGAGVTPAPANDGHPENGQPRPWQPQGIAPTIIGDIIGSYKSLVTKECLEIFKQKMSWINPTPYMGKIWQRNYHEHIIRNEKEYLLISNYILNNPLNWKEDKFYYD